MKVSVLHLFLSTALALPLANTHSFDQHVFKAQSLPLVDSKSLQSGLSEAKLEARAEALFAAAEESIPQYGHPTRVIESAGHNATLKYILDTLEGLSDYYVYYTQPFIALNGRIRKSSLVLSDHVVEDAQPFEFSPSTPGKKNVTAPLTVAKVANGCDVSAYGPEVEGSLVLVERGDCPFGVKSEQAGLAGAVGLIVYDNEEATAPIRGSLEEPQPHHVPTYGITQWLGHHLVDLLERGFEITGEFSLDSRLTYAHTYNVIAESKYGDHDNVVMVGAHSDSVEAGPGINDDGSGSLTLLEVATALAEYNVTNAVRFAWWAAEEEGLLGSNYYANNLTPEENSKIRLFLDYDMMASPNYVNSIYDGNNVDNPAGSEEIKQLYMDFYTSKGENYTFVAFDGRSDYVGFITHGIPGGGVAAGAEVLKTEAEVEQFGGVAGEQYDQCYHLLCDDLTNPNYYIWLVNTQLVAHSVATYASSLEGFPERTPFAAESVPEFKFRGSKLVM